MFIRIAANSDGSHASQHGGTMQEGWAFWDMKAVAVPGSFPYVDIEVEEVHHDAVTTTRGEETIVLIPEYSQMEVVSATAREIPEEPEPEASQLDIIEAQVTYTAMMTDTLLEV